MASTEGHWENVYATKDLERVSWFESTDSIPSSSSPSTPTHEDRFVSTALSLIGQGVTPPSPTTVIFDAGCGASSKFLAAAVHGAERFLLGNSTNSSAANPDQNQSINNGHEYINNNNNNNNNNDDDDNNTGSNTSGGAQTASHGGAFERVHVLGADLSSAAVTALSARIAREGGPPARALTNTHCPASPSVSLRITSLDVLAAVSSGTLSAQSVSLWHDRAVLHFLSAPGAAAEYAAVCAAATVVGGFAVISVFARDGGPDKCSGIEVVKYDERAMAELMGDRFVIVESGRDVHVTPWGSEQRFAVFLLRRV